MAIEEIEEDHTIFSARTLTLGNEVYHEYKKADTKLSGKYEIQKSLQRESNRDRQQTEQHGTSKAAGNQQWPMRKPMERHPLEKGE